MRQPPDFIDNRFPKHMCHHKKAIYDLKQAPRAWFRRFSSFCSYMVYLYLINRIRPCLFFRHDSHILILLLHVDGIILIGSSISLIFSFISTPWQFAMKYLGDLHYFLQVHITCSPSGLFLSQYNYISDLLLKFHLHTCKPVCTPIVAKTTLKIS